MRLFPICDVNAQQSAGLIVCCNPCQAGAHARRDDPTCFLRRNTEKMGKASQRSVASASHWLWFGLFCLIVMLSKEFGSAHSLPTSQQHSAVLQLGAAVASCRGMGCHAGSPCCSLTTPHRDPVLLQGGAGCRSDVGQPEH